VKRADLPFVRWPWGPGADLTVWPGSCFLADTFLPFSPMCRLASCLFDYQRCSHSRYCFFVDIKRTPAGSLGRRSCRWAVPHPFLCDLLWFSPPPCDLLVLSRSSGETDGFEPVPHGLGLASFSLRASRRPRKGSELPFHTLLFILFRRRIFLFG